jgi:mRNA-degrading endonuclease RelE of RelBE toxin-antitoxin system
MCSKYLLPQLASTIKIKKDQKLVKSCQKVVKKLSKSCQKLVQKLVKKLLKKIPKIRDTLIKTKQIKAMVQ